MASSAPWMDGSATEWLRQILNACGIERGETESLAGAFARALGITTQELKAHLQEIACGHD
ncbi:MAG: hypothetical protein ABI833_17955 [Acidobacteriota bacterium]